MLTDYLFCHFNDYTTGNLLDFTYFKKKKKKKCKLIAIDLSKKTKLKDPQQVSFIAKLLNTCGATMFFIIEKNQKKLPLIFHKILSQSYTGKTKNCKFAKWF